MKCHNKKKPVLVQEIVKDFENVKTLSLLLFLIKFSITTPTDINRFIETFNLVKGVVASLVIVVIRSYIIILLYIFQFHILQPLPHRVYTPRIRIGGKMGSTIIMRMVAPTQRDRFMRRIKVSV